MRYGWTVGGLLVLGAIAVPIAAQQAKDEKSPQDKARIEKELSDLEGQGTKLDSRIRDLQRQLGREDRVIRVRDGGELKAFVMPRIEIERNKNLTQEQQTEVKRAMEQAHRAVEEAMRNLPDK